MANDKIADGESEIADAQKELFDARLELADAKQANKEWVYIAYDDALDKVEVQLSAQKDGCTLSRSCPRQVYAKELLADFVRISNWIGAGSGVQGDRPRRAKR